MFSFLWLWFKPFWSKNKNICVSSNCLFNPFHATDLFLYPVKTFESHRISEVFWGYRKRPVSWNGFSRLVLLQNSKWLYIKVNFIWVFHVHACEMKSENMWLKIKIIINGTTIFYNNGKKVVKWIRKSNRMVTPEGFPNRDYWQFLWGKYLKQTLKYPQLREILFRHC